MESEAVGVGGVVEESVQRGSELSELSELDALEQALVGHRNGVAALMSDWGRQMQIFKSVRAQLEHREASLNKREVSAHSCGIQLSAAASGASE